MRSLEGVLSVLTHQNVGVRGLSMYSTNKAAKLLSDRYGPGEKIMHSHNCGTHEARPSIVLSS